MINFNRIKNFIDVELMNNNRISVVGVGGMSEGVIDLCRSGITSFILVDPDDYEDVNLATQGGNIHDIGQAKVEVTKNRLSAINPNVKVTCIKKKYQDLSHDELTSFWNSNLVLMMTDSFDAQALGNKHSIKYQVPTIFAASYMNQDALEITWNAPGLTTHCHRCVTLSRYVERDNGYEQPTGAGSYVFTGRQLNAMIGQLALSMLHHYGKSNLAIKEMIKKLGNNNFLLIKILPDYGIDSGVFEEVTPFSTKSFAPDTPKGFVCPDCGAEGVI